MGQLDDNGTPLPSDELLDVDDDVEHRIAWAMQGRYQRALGILLTLAGAAFVTFFWSDLATEQMLNISLPLSGILLARLAAAALLLVSAWFLLKRELSAGVTLTLDVIAAITAGVLLGYLHVASHGGNPLYLASLPLFAVPRCIFVPSPNRITVLVCAVSWGSSVAFIATAGALGVPTASIHGALGWIGFAGLNGFVFSSLLIAIVAAFLVRRLHVELIEAQARGRYRLAGILGRGGYGVVHSAWDHLLDRSCAIKLLDSKWARNDEELLRFGREARATSKLSDPHVVQVLDFGRTRDGRIYYVMEHLQGSDLGSLLRHSTILPRSESLGIVKQAAMGLATAHAAGIMHRDVKPENLFIIDSGSPSMHVKVLDFGLVAPITSEGSYGEHSNGAATPAYVSPERARGQRGDHRSDVYSLGAVLYRLLVGRPVFSGSPLSLLMKHANEQPTPPSEIDPSIDEQLEFIMLSCLQKEPDQRFSRWTRWSLPS